MAGNLLFQLYLFPNESDGVWKSSSTACSSWRDQSPSLNSHIKRLSMSCHSRSREFDHSFGRFRYTQMHVQVKIISVKNLYIFIKIRYIFIQYT